VTKLADRGVVIARVIEHKVADRARVNIKLLQYREYNLSLFLTRVSARQLRQRDRQVLKLAGGRDVVGDNTKKALLAALRRLTVKAKMYFAYQLRQLLDHQRLQVVVQAHDVA
jgi:hypothetical protein